MRTKFAKKEKIIWLVLLLAIAFSVFGIPARQADAADPPLSPEVEAQKNEGEAAAQASQNTGAPCQGTFSIPLTGISVPTDFTCLVLSAVDWLVDGLFGIPFSIAEYFFTWMLETNFNFSQPNSFIQLAVVIGYRVVLGVANMFFVLILLWIAVATIFDFEPYTARSLLMTLIVTALLINFSLPIANAFIGLSHGITRIFYNQLIQTSDTKSLRGVIAQAFRVKELVDFATKPVSRNGEKESVNLQLCKGKTSDQCADIISRETTVRTTDDSGAAVTVTAYQCNTDNNARRKYPAACSAAVRAAENQAKLTPTDPRSIYGIFALTIAWKTILYPIAIFALFAISILLLNRIITLAFILILGPAAFLMNILPGTKQINKMWWDNLIKWSFFLPSFMFFFWLSMVMVRAIPREYYIAQLAGVNAPNIYSAVGAYIIAVGFLIASVIVATKFGVYGSSTVTGWGQKMSKAAGGWARDRGWKYGGMATSLATRIPGVRGVVGRIAPLRAGAAAVMKRGEGVAKKDTAFYTKLSDRELSNSLRGMSRGQRQEIWNALDQKRRAKIHEEAEKQGFDIGVSVGKPTWRQSAASAITGRPVPGPVGIIRPSLNDMRQSVRESMKSIFDEMLNSGEMRGIGEDLPAVQGAVRNALEEAVSKMPARATPEEFNSAVREFTDRAVKKAFPNKPQHAASVQQSIRSRADKIGRAAGSAMRTKVEKPKPPTIEDLVEKIGELEDETGEIKSKQQKI